MRYALLSLLIITALLFRPSSGRAQPPHHSLPGVICWQPNRKLRWRDFQASAPPADARTPPHTRLAACCASEIAVLPYRDEHDRATLRVESFFVKSRSWVRDSLGPASRQHLAHEQLHFDITELFARKIREKIAQQYAGTRPDNGLDLQDEISRLLNEHNEFDQRYDRETHRDASPWLLQRWQALVARELAALAAYQSTTSTCGHR